MSRKYRGSVVNSKYGARPLIDVPPISLENSNDFDGDDQRQVFHVPGSSQSNPARGIYHRPPQLVQPSLTMPPLQPRYQEPVAYQPQVYQQPSYTQPYQHQYQQPQYQQNNTNQLPVPAPPAHGFPFSNIIQNSNIVPYDSKPMPHYRQPATAPHHHQHYPQTNGMMGQKEANGEVHIYYGPNGERLPGPPKGPRYPTDFTLEGNLEYGKLVSVSIRNSNISYRDIPSFIFDDLQKTYGKIENTTVKIVAQGGEYNIYSTPHVQYNSEPKMRYMYDQPDERQRPIRRDSVYDPYTKIYEQERLRSRDHYR